MTRLNRWTGIKKIRSSSRGRSIGHGVEQCPECKSKNTRVHWQGDLFCKNCGVETPAEKLSSNMEETK